MPTPDLSKLDPEHLRPAEPDLEAMKMKALAAAEPEKPKDASAEAAEKKRKLEEKLAKMRDPGGRYTFHFTYSRDPRFSGTFTSVVPDLGKMQSIGVFRAQLTGGMPYASLDALTQQLALARATLAFLLDDTMPNFPEWAKSLNTLHDPDVLFELYEEVQLHQATFLRR